jgi:hypothetical protein
MHISNARTFLEHIAHISNARSSWLLEYFCQPQQAGTHTRTHAHTHTHVPETRGGILSSLSMHVPVEIAPNPNTICRGNEGVLKEASLQAFGR